MTTNPVTACDCCLTAKKETNNWLRARVSTDGALVIFHASGSADDVKFYDTKDICGQECAAKMLQRWMTTGTLEDA